MRLFSIKYLNWNTNYILNVHSSIVCEVKVSSRVLYIVFSQVNKVSVFNVLINMNYSKIKCIEKIEYMR